jgi:archaeosine-15-forming tRNA-guanine transglycosylase
MPSGRREKDRQRGTRKEADTNRLNRVRDILRYQYGKKSKEFSFKSKITKFEIHA